MRRKGELAVQTPQAIDPVGRAAKRNKRVPSCWVVSDGRRGIENQALGLAEAVARSMALEVIIHHAPRPSASRMAQGMFTQMRDHLITPKAGEASPDLWIGCGRSALYRASVDKQRHRAAKFVFVQDPKRSHKLFDLIVPPEHDGLTGANVFPILGSPNRITPQILSRAREQFADRINFLPGPRAAVLIGGVSKRHSLTPDLASQLIDDLIRLKGEASLMISTSRRTPPDVLSALRGAFGSAGDVWLWTGDDDGPNPYFAFLAAADVALVTKDSTNMLTEAASAGVPVMLLAMAGKDGKFTELYDALMTRGLARPFEGALEIWPTPAFNETERAAQAVLKLLDAQ